MPVTPLFDWEQTILDVTIRVTIKGFKADTIDVFISDVFVKVNASPTYLLLLDLLHPIVVQKSSFRIDGSNVKITLPKVTEGLWETLCIDRKSYFGGDLGNNKHAVTEQQLDNKKKTTTKAESHGCVEELPDEDDTDTTATTTTETEDKSRKIYNSNNADGDDTIYRPKSLNERRKAAIARAEQLYNTKLDTREKQKEIEKKRMHHEQWELEKQQRQAIIDKVKREKEKEQERLYEWERQEKAKIAAQKLRSPADVTLHTDNDTNNNNKSSALSSSSTSPSSSSSLPAASTYGLALPSAPVPPVGIRNTGETATYTIDFTPKSLAAPTRTRGDEDYYRRSKYRPVSVEDSPMFWKERGDKHYRNRDFRAAADAYTESIKRDGVFLSCVSNRAAAFIQLHEYKKAVEDCDLALTLLANTPASETTQERYKAQMCKLHARRGAAKCWGGADYSSGLDDLRLAVAYRDASDKDLDLVADLETVQSFMQRNGIAEDRDPSALLSGDAAREYYSGEYEKAIDTYTSMLTLNEFDIKARNNLAAALLQLGRHREALAECGKVIEFCGEVAAALNEPGATVSAGGGGGGLADSDDEDEGEDEFVMRKKAAARKIGERSGHVYLLLKAYVRSAAALCGLKDYRRAYEFMELAVRITPYDDDLREDANKILEKLKFTTLISASTGKDAVAAAQAMTGVSGGGDDNSGGSASPCVDGCC